MMNNDELRAAGQLMIDVADGKVKASDVQRKPDYDTPWADIPGQVTWNWFESHYRERPKPREWWINEYPGEGGYSYSSEELADKCANHAVRRGKAIHVVEKT